MTAVRVVHFRRGPTAGPPRRTPPMVCIVSALNGPYASPWPASDPLPRQPQRGAPGPSDGLPGALPTTPNPTPPPPPPVARTEPEPAPPPAGPVDADQVRLVVRCRARYMTWAEGLADHLRIPLANCVDWALTDLAHAVGYDAEAPARTSRAHRRQPMGTPTDPVAEEGRRSGPGTQQHDDEAAGVDAGRP